ncbi:MAG TPA: hypothetical protein DC009_05280, partial [Porphyromonadaceae bacterium]|nr:hypothetical protein [Porphyromonadaceae bacterium]
MRTTLLCPALAICAAFVPLGAAAEVTSITVSEPGTLSTLISQDQKFAITELKVTGSINGDDIGFIREMAGVSLSSYDTPTEGQLTKLDLYDAAIVAGGYYIDSKYSWEKKQAEANTIGDNMFRKSKLTAIEFPQGLTKVGQSAFAGAPVASVILPPGVTSVGSEAFSGCTSLTEASFPSAVTSIGSLCFQNCSSLASFTVPDITALADQTFAGCTAMTEIELPATLQSIGYAPFPSSLTALRCLATTPPTTTWGPFSGINFSSCTLYVPAGTVAAYAAASNWSQFTNIQEITGETPPLADELTVTLTEAGTLSTIFRSDEEKWNVKKITVSGPLNGSDLKVLREMTGIDDRWNATDGKLVSIDMSGATLVAGGEPFVAAKGSEDTDEPAWIQARENCLPEELFSESKLETIVLPTSIIGIYSSFADATALKGSIVVPEGVTFIGEWAFSNTAIEGITLPSTLADTEDRFQHNKSAIGSNAFNGCSRLASVNIPAGVTILKSNVFAGCAALTEFRLPASVDYIDGNAFANCTGIKDFYVETLNPAYANYGAFSGMDFDGCILHVPSHATQNYRNADEWSNFISILEADPIMTGVTFATQQDDFSGVTVTVDGNPAELTGNSAALNMAIGSVIVVAPKYNTIIDAVEAANAHVKEDAQENTFAVTVMGDGCSVSIAWHEAKVRVEAISTYDGATLAGKLSLEYDGNTGSSFELPIGATVTFVAEPAEGYQFKYVTPVTDGSDDSEDAGTSYTAAKADSKDGKVFKGVFEYVGSVDGIDADAFRYDAQTKTVYASSGLTEVYATSGQRLISSREGVLSLASLPAGLYVVRNGGKSLK